jgi:DNA-binding transcriptional MerR regulator
MRIGELAQEVGVSTDTVRFYERSGWLPRANRSDNAYREYGDADVEHLRLLIDLRRLDLPLDDAELPGMIEERRTEIADRITGLQALDARLAGLLGHLGRPRRSLAVLDGPCCEAADAVVGAAEGGCPCCSSMPMTTD